MKLARTTLAMLLGTTALFAAGSAFAEDTI